MAVTADDQKLLKEIMDTREPERLAARLFDYYHDADRAERTSRKLMYLHMGMLTGAVWKLLDRRKDLEAL